MKAERQQREPQKTEPIQSKRERSRLSFVDNRPEATCQTKLIANIRNCNEEKQTLQKKGKMLNFPKSTIIQRLIVVDNDMDVSRLLAAVHILKKHDGERITTIEKASSFEISRNEKIYLVAHGSENSHGGRSAKDLAEIILGWHLNPGENTIKLISCFTGKNAPEWSYSNELALKLGFRYKVVGIKGLEGTDERGHTRATEQLVEESAFDNVYFNILANDTSLQHAEVIAENAKNHIDRCEPGEENKIMLDAYNMIYPLCQVVFRKLEEGLKGMTKENSKRDSEDVMTAIH